jgi:hypothetical protein
MLSAEYDPAQGAGVATLPADALLTSGEYARFRAGL